MVDLIFLGQEMRVGLVVFVQLKDEVCVIERENLKVRKRERIR